MNETIKLKLLELQDNESIKILYACESGSRAWGFASTDSDFDVRFIYARSTDEYLNINDIRDVIDLPVNEVLDINGWDIRKSLKLFLKSNGPLYEWLQSPIVYKTETDFAYDLRRLMSDYFCLRSGGYHYLSMANNTLTNDLQAERVKLKRYFYALRSALACLWIIEKQTVPPMEFKKLRVLLTDETIQESIDDLLKIKTTANEKTLVAPVTLLNDWLADILAQCKEQVPKLSFRRKQPEELNSIFRKYVLS